MPYSIEIRFDPETEARILDYWRSAARYYGSDYLFKNGVVPHIALLVGDSHLEILFHQIDIPKGLVKLSDLSFFGDGSVSYLRAELPQEVTDFQKSIYQSAIELGAVVDPHYAPKSWIPHCTIAQNCTTNKSQPMAEFNAVARIESLILVLYPPTCLMAERCSSP